MPLENALTGIPGVHVMRSKSVMGLSQVVLVLEHGADHLKVRQMVQERIAAEARQLPTVAMPPVILQPLSSTSRAMKIGIWSDKLSQQDLTILALWTIRPKLMSVPGVANVAIWGQRDKQFQVVMPHCWRPEGSSTLRISGSRSVMSRRFAKRRISRKPSSTFGEALRSDWEM
jgi:Cu/Ag efflux pump CusA